MRAYVMNVSICLCSFVDLVMGKGECAFKKLECGNPLTVLGVQADMNLAGMVFSPSPLKTKELIEQIGSYLICGHLTAGETSKLAGACSLFGSGAPVRLICFACHVAWASLRSMCSTDWQGHFLFPSSGRRVR